MTDQQTTTHHSSRHDPRNLSTLEEWQLEDSEQDLRGHLLHDSQGHPMGKVADMLVDLDARRVVALRLENERIVDIDDVDIRDGRAVLLSSGAAGIARDTSGHDQGQHMPIVEEKMNVGKRVTDLSNVTVRTRIVERPVSQDVTLQREHVDVQRRPADRSLSSADADALLRDGVVEISERGEQAVVGKSARVVEEVVVRKGVESHTERIEGSVRHTEVEVDRDAAPIRRDDRRR